MTRLRKSDLVKCAFCRRESKVADLKPVLYQKDEAGVLVNLVCPFCKGCEMEKVEK